MKSPRIVHLAVFAMVVSGNAGTALANIIYSFTTIDARVSGLAAPKPLGLTTAARSWDLPSSEAS